jgi:hypothetical protein
MIRKSPVHDLKFPGSAVPDAALKVRMAFADLVHAWHDFYLLVGTASATLVGLMFVAASIGANVFKEDNRAAMRAFISPTVVHFGAILLVCIVGAVPSHTWSTLAALLILGGVGGLAYSARIWTQLFVRRSFDVDIVDRLFYALVPVLGHALILLAAGLLLAHSTWGLDALAAALVTLMFAGLRNAWDMTIWIVIRTPVIDRGEAGR